MDDLRDALHGAKVVAYAQGFAQLARASDEHGWSVDLAGLAAIWRGGCIIRARFLDRIREAYAGDRPADLVLAPAFTRVLADVLPGWRRVVAGAVGAGIPVPASSAALAWYDGDPPRRARRRTSSRPSAYLFGAHTYRRLDRDGDFHSDWALG